MAVRIGGTVLTERRGAISGNHMINVTCDGVCVCVCGIGRDQIKKGKDEASPKSLKESNINN